MYDIIRINNKGQMGSLIYAISVPFFVLQMTTFTTTQNIVVY